MSDPYSPHPRRPRGNESGREKRRNESFQAPVFVAPFLLARLTAPGSPRMYSVLNGADPEIIRKLTATPAE